MLKKTTLLFFVLVWLSSCSVEHETIQNHQATTQVKSSLLQGAEAQKVQEKVQHIIRRAPDPFQIGNLQSCSEIPVSVDYSRIMQVVDSLGNTTYSMYVKNHPLETNKAFYNVVARLVGTTDLQVSLKRFEKAYVTAFDSQTQVGSVKDFTGLVITAPIIPDVPSDPCPPEMIGGGGFVGGNTGPFAPGGGGGGGDTAPLEHPCGIIMIQFLCCHNMHFGEEPNCKCAATNGNIGATYLVDGCAGTITQQYRSSSASTSEESPCEEEEPPTGVVTPINDCQTNFAATFPQGTPERDFLNEHPEIEVALDGVLFKTNDCEEDTAFANWAIDYLMEHPEILPDDNVIEKLENIFWQEEFIDATDLENNPCTNAVYQEMKQTQLMAKLLRRFSGTKPILNLDWDISNLGACNANSCLNGQTTYTSGDSYVNITLNSNMISAASKIWIAKTMLHELIHAEIIRLLVMEGDEDLDPDPNNFPSLWNAYVDNLSNFDHEYMANYYVSKMSGALQEYCNSAGITATPETLTAICWSGLHNTTAWNNLPQTTRQNYFNTWILELSAGGCP